MFRQAPGHHPLMPRHIDPIDPDSPAGRAAAEALGQALAEIYVRIWQRRAAAQTLSQLEERR